MALSRYSCNRVKIFSELCSMDHLPYHDDVDPFAQVILAHTVRSGDRVIGLFVVISDQCEVGKKFSNQVRAKAVGAAWNRCGEMLRSFHHSCNQEARHN